MHVHKLLSQISLWSLHMLIRDDTLFKPSYLRSYAVTIHVLSIFWIIDSFDKFI